MEYPETFALHFARGVSCFGQPGAKEEQKDALRAILGHVNAGSATLEHGGDRLLVNEVPVIFPAVRDLLAQLRRHRVKAVHIAQAPRPVDVFNLLKALSAPDTVVDVGARLTTAGSTSVRVERMTESEAEEAEPVPRAAPRATRPSGEPLALVGPAIPTVEQAIRELAQDPTGPRVPELLRVLVTEAQQAVDGDWINHALTIAHALIQLEERVAGEPQTRHQFAIALRTLLERRYLERYARLTVDPELGEAIVEVLRRAGADGTHVLLGLLTEAGTMRERFAYFRALTQMPEGHPSVIDMLDDDRWYVVRNVAALCGELGLADAVPKLGGLLDHTDERVRRSAALALAKIGTPTTTEYLRRALRDRAPEVRRQVAAGLVGRKSTAMAMPLVVALDDETHSDVQQEILRALGRIGTPDAVQALVKMAQPGGRLFRRRPVQVRLAAIEGLLTAGTHTAFVALESLTADSDVDIRAAAEQAMSQLRS